MKLAPLNFERLDGERLLFTDDVGGFFQSDRAFLERLVSDQLTGSDRAFLQKHGHADSGEKDVVTLGRVAKRIWRTAVDSTLDYVILVPTLRCNLSCDYCQVSRAGEMAQGFDWSERTLNSVLAFLDGLETKRIKVEIQGGEPLLRLDLLDQVRAFCRERFQRLEFVVCTNLQKVSEAAWDFLAASDTFVSTSLDGTFARHQSMRTKTEARQTEFEANLRRAVESFGTEKVSALPTIDPLVAPDPPAMIEAFASLGLTSIYLRRINHLGFARKRFDPGSGDSSWQKFYRAFLDALVAHNSVSDQKLEEYYLSHLVRRILQGGHDTHLDQRNPNWLGSRYIVIDFDGRFYPTDEARMVTRTGQIDLSVGSLDRGLDRQKLDRLNDHVWNGADPDCLHCAFQPYCGLDIVDDLSRYGRIDLPRPHTHHCRSQMFLFRLAFELIYSNDPQVQSTLAHWLRVPKFSAAAAPRLT